MSMGSDDPDEADSFAARSPEKLSESLSGS